MPARSLSNDPSTVDPFDVLAQSDGTSNLMIHALLCNEAESRGDVTRQSEIKCAHMGPPLGLRVNRCDAVGSADLNDTHRRKIKVFLDDRLKERSSEKDRLRLLGRSNEIRTEYRIQPPATKPSRAFPLWRFSCVGFVLQSYLAARIQLLGSPLPLKTVEELKRLYPGAADSLDDPNFRDRVGISHGDRWPVALVGYVLNSLARDVAAILAIPYVPEPGDEMFPRETPIVS